MPRDIANEWIKAAPYISVKIDHKATEIDQVGCDGLYVKEIKIKWWGYPFIIIEALIEIGTGVIVGKHIKAMKK